MYPFDIMDGPELTLSEINLSEKDKYHMILHVESNEQTKLASKIETDSSRTGRQVWSVGGVRKVEGLSKKMGLCILFHIFHHHLSPLYHFPPSTIFSTHIPPPHNHTLLSMSSSTHCCP